MKKSLSLSLLACVAMLHLPVASMPAGGAPVLKAAYAAKKALQATPELTVEEAEEAGRKFDALHVGAGAGRARSAPCAGCKFGSPPLPLLGRVQTSPETGVPQVVNVPPPLPLLERVQTERDPGQIPGNYGGGEGDGLASSGAALRSNAVKGDQAGAASESKVFKLKTLRDEAGSGSIKPSSEIGYAASAADFAGQLSAASVTPVPSPTEQQKVAQSASADLAGQPGTAPVANASSSPIGRSDAKPKKGLFGCCIPRRRSRGEAL